MPLRTTNDPGLRAHDIAEGVANRQYKQDGDPSAFFENYREELDSAIHVLPPAVPRETDDKIGYWLESSMKDCKAGTCNCPMH